MTTTAIDRVPTLYFYTNFQDCEVATVDQVVSRIHTIFQSGDKLYNQNAITRLKTQISELSVSIDSATSLEDLSGLYTNLLECRGHLQTMRSAKITLEFAVAFFTKLESEAVRISIPTLKGLAAECSEIVEAKIQLLKEKAPQAKNLEFTIHTAYDNLVRLFEEKATQYISKYDAIVKRENPDAESGEQKSSYKFVALLKQGISMLSTQGLLNYIGTEFSKIEVPASYTQLLQANELDIPEDAAAVEKLHLHLLGLFFKLDETDKTYSVLQNKIYKVEAAIRFNHWSTLLDKGKYPDQLHELLELKKIFEAIPGYYAEKKEKCIEYARMITALINLIKQQDPEAMHLEQMKIDLQSIAALAHAPEALKKAIAEKYLQKS